MEYPPPPPVPSDVDPATLAAYPLEELAGAQQAELMGETSLRHGCRSSPRRTNAPPFRSATCS